MAKPRARSAGAGGHPDAQRAPAAVQPKQGTHAAPPGRDARPAARPLREPLDPVALLAAAAVLVAIALAAWLALFHQR